MKQKKVLEFNTLESFMLLSFSYLFILTFLKSTSTILSVLIIIIFFSIYLKALLKRVNNTITIFKKIITLVNFRVNDYKDDLKNRITIVNEISAILTSILLVLAPLFNNSNEFIVIKYLSIIFIACCIFNYLFKFSNIILTTLLIFVTTFFGVVLLFSLLSVLLSIISLSRGVYLDPFFAINQKDFAMVIVATSDYRFFIINSLVSIGLQLCFILARPNYLNDQTKLAFKLTSIIVTVATLILVFFSNDIFLSFNSYLSSYIDQNTLSVLRDQGYKGATDFRNLYDKLLQIIFLPYTIGAIVGLFVLDFISYRRQKKSKKYYIKAINELDYEKCLIYLKKSIYLGGGLAEIQIKSNTNFRKYFDEIGIL